MTQKEENSVKTVKKDSKIKQSSISGGEGKIKKTSRSTNKNIVEFMTRIVVRQLPPTMSEEQFLEEVSPLSEHTEFYFANGDQSLGEFAFSRAYIKFNNIDDVLLFKDRYDDYVFVDSKGNEFPAIVEYAPIQKLPRRFNFTNIKKDSKVNTIENDADFLSFKEELENVDNSNQMTAEQLLEEIEKKQKESKENDAQKTTPLVEYLNQKRLEKIKIKEDKKRKKEEIKKKKKDEPQQHTKKEKELSSRPKKEAKHEDRNNRHHHVKENKNKPEQERKIVLQNNKLNSNSHKSTNNNANTSDETTAKKDQNTSKSTAQPDKNPGNSSNNSNNNINKRKDSNKTTPGTSTAAADKEKKEKELARIRNKDRPTREIYRPGVARQQQKSEVNQNQKESNNNHDQLSQSQQQHSKSAPDKNTSIKPTPVDKAGDRDQQPNTNNQRKQSQPPKYKQRVFTRTKN